MVLRLLPHHRYVCLRHRTWIGPPDADWPAADLSELPDIVHAQRRHLRLLHRRGVPLTFDAVLTAFSFCGHIWNSADDHPKQRGPDHIWHTWDARTRVLIPEDDEALMYGSYSTSKLFAAVHPEAVSLAVIIASPYWRRVADARSPRERERFLQEISTHITYPYDDASVFGDAIGHWSNTDSWRPPSQPLRTYSPARATGSPPPLHRAQSRRDEKSAANAGSGPPCSATSTSDPSSRASGDRTTNGSTAPSGTAHASTKTSRQKQPVREPNWATTS
ncbi:MULTISPECIES: hypothetical protein [Streptomyces]|uniref:hypothetical protein n=1 Tax=Streptomyces TaxID=1883 RepID=UPI00131A0827|nr:MULTISPECIES: hypothetical protein [Streptomyces]MYS94147.1 hypothetical protein [Streptomyces sp. SID5464]